MIGFLHPMRRTAQNSLTRLPVCVVVLAAAFLAGCVSVLSLARTSNRQVHMSRPCRFPVMCSLRGQQRRLSGGIGYSSRQCAPIRNGVTIFFKARLIQSQLGRSESHQP